LRQTTTGEKRACALFTLWGQGIYPGQHAKPLTIKD